MFPIEVSYTKKFSKLLLPYWKRKKKVVKSKVVIELNGNNKT